MRYLSVIQVLEIYRNIILQTGGAFALRDMGSLESAVARPQMTFGNADLYQSLHEKAAALAFSILKNHPFVDGNKRTAHAAMEIFLVMNGWELHADVDEQEAFFLKLANGEISQNQFGDWISKNIVKIS